MGKIKVALIDADSLMYYEMNAPTLEEAQEGIDNRIHSIISLTKCDAYAGFLTIGRCFRYGLAKTKAYKSVGSHELLHGIIGNSFYKLSETERIKLGKSFMGVLSNGA